MSVLDDNTEISGWTEYESKQKRKYQKVIHIVLATLLITVTTMLIATSVAVGQNRSKHHHVTPSHERNGADDRPIVVENVRATASFNVKNVKHQTIETKLYTGENGAVSTDVPKCSEIGVSIMRDFNGNAIDAAVASGLCVGILNCVASGVGGGGIMLIATGSEVVTLDFRETAPGAAHRDMYNNLTTDSSQIGGLSIAVPGEIKGLYQAWQKYGSISWEHLVMPSVQLARDGFPLSSYMHWRLSQFESKILNHPSAVGLREIFAPKGKILPVGTIVKMPKLARTLQTIAEHGAHAFYNPSSKLAQDIVSDIKRAGGLVTAEDLASFKVKIAPPLSSYYHGFKVYGAQPEIVGGPCSLFMLNILERYMLQGKDPRSFDTQQLIIEAQKFAFGHRMELGDPDFTNENATKVLELMLDKDYASRVRGSLLKRTETNPDFNNYLPHIPHTLPMKASVSNQGTAHFSVVDKNRMAVSMTSTVNLPFGSMVVGEKTGILFNDEMDDFSIPNRPNAYNLPPAEANFIAPGKRPLSSMTPTIVYEDGKLRMVIGASGGPLILSATTQVLLNVLSFDMPIHEAIDRPRFHHQLLPPVLKYEPGHSDALLTQLARAGHELVETNLLGFAHGVVVSEDSRTLTAAADKRKKTLAAAY